MHVCGKAEVIERRQPEVVVGDHLVPLDTMTSVEALKWERLWTTVRRVVPVRPLRAPVVIGIPRSCIFVECLAEAQCEVPRLAKVAG